MPANRPVHPPGKSAIRRARLTERIADVLLAQSVAILPLRDLADTLGTSDRMLLYYFGTQAGLITAALACLSERLSRQLEQALPDAALPPAQLFKKLTVIMARPDIARILRVWADVVARGARGEAPFREFAQGSVAGWLGRLESRLDVADRSRREKTAAAILVVIEGMRLIELSAPGAAKGAVPVLAKAFADKF
jgi:AcrR family transcriptional regulator